MAGMRSPMRNPMRSPLSRALNDPRMSLANQALAILRKFGTDAHVYLPGSTVTTYGGESASDSEFDNAALWSLTQPTSGVVSVSGGKMRVNSADGSYCIAISTNQVAVVGKTYRVTLDIESYTGTVAVGNAGGSNIPSGTGIVTVDWTAQEQQFSLKRSGGACDIVVRSYSVREKITTSSVTAGLPTNNYTLSNGSTGYSAVDGTAGLVLDAAGSVGAELAPVTTSSTGWSGINCTVAAVGGSIVGTANTSGATAIQVYFDIPTVIGSTYHVVQPLSGASLASVTSQLVKATDTAFTLISQDTLSALPETADFFFKATSTTSRITARVDCTLTSGTSTISIASSLSVKEVTGIHVTQSTTANKPALRRGSYNLLTYSQDFSNAAWTTNAATKTSTTAQDALGGSTACLVTVTSATGAHQLVSPTISQTIGLVYTQSVYVKPGSANRCQVTCGSAAFGFTCYANFSLVGSGSVLASGAGVTARIQPDRDGFYKLSITLSATATGTSSAVAVAFIDSDTATRSPSFTGNGTDSLTVCFAQSEAGTTAGDYSPTTSAAASNQSAGRYSWQFDGSNDSLALGSVPFQMSDDHCVIGAASSQAPTGDRYIADVGNVGSVNAMCASLALAGTSAKAYWRDDSLAITTLTGGTVAQGSVGVLSARKSSGTGVLRVNGTQVASGAISLGTTTLTGASLGVRVSPGNYFNGAIGPVILIKGTVSDADLLTLERWAASLTPNGPQF